MKSKTSFFNGTVLKKDITRYAPLWALYAVFLVVLFLSGQREETVLTANAVANILSEIAPVNLIYGGLCANVLFGDLFNARLCNALHAMPLRREGWFFTHICAGLLFCIVPVLLGALFLMLLLQEFYYIALLWLAVMVLQFLFFFGLGIFSTMCAGNRLGMAAVYLIINFFFVLVYALAAKVYEPLMFGFEFTEDPFLFFCPVYHLSSEQLISFNYEHFNGAFINGHIDHFYPEVWAYLFVVAAIGIVLTFLALLLYRKRKLECTGDFMAFRCLSPIFLVIYTLACGVFLYALSSVFGFAVDYALMAIGVVVGFFTGRMLLKRTVRVFQKRSFLAFGAFVLVLFGSLILTKLDPLRLTWYVPDSEDIAYMHVYRDIDRHIRYSEDDFFRMQTPEQVETFRNVHAQLLQERQPKTDGASYVYITYKLHNGREVRRYYAFDENTAAYDDLRTYFSDYRYVFRTGADWNTVMDSITMIELSVHNYYLKVEEAIDTSDDLPSAAVVETQRISDPEKIAQLLEAIRKDCDAGNMAQSYTFHIGEDYMGWCYLSSNVLDEKGDFIANGNLFCDISLYPCATHTKAVVDQWIQELMPS